MPTDIKREFLTGSIPIEKLEIIINERIPDDGPVPLGLDNVGTHDARATQSDHDTSNDMWYHDACAIAWKGYIVGRGVGNKGPHRT